MKRHSNQQVVTVAVTLGQAQLRTHRLHGPPDRLVRAFTTGTLAVGVSLAILGMVSAASGQAGVAALTLVFGLGIVVYAATRLGEQRRSPHFTVGTSPKADLGLDQASVPGPLFPLVRHGADGHELVFSRGMQGQMSQGVLGMDLLALVRTGQARELPELPGCFAVPLLPEAVYEVRLGEARIQVSGGAEARDMRGSMLSRVDWDAQLFHGLSFAAHALILFLVVAIPPDGMAVNSDLYNGQDRHVRYLIKAPEVDATRVPPWLQRRTHEEQKPAAEARERTRERPSVVRKNIPSPSDRAGGGALRPSELRHLVTQSVQGAGVLLALNSAGSPHLNGLFGADSALPDGAAEAMDGLIGDSSGETLGVGGLGLSGTGHGPWGPGDGIAAGPLGTLGRGGQGPDGGRYGDHVKLPTRRKKDGDILKAEHPDEVRGGLSREIVRRIIRRNLNQVRYCYQRELSMEQDLQGRLVVRFTIAGTGQVVASGVTQSTLNHPEVETCIAQAVRRWLFPKPDGGGIVVVSYPFVLHSAGR